MKTDTCITNRIGDIHDGWMHVCPLGEHLWESADGKERIMQVIDRAACEAMAASYPLDGQEALIDWEHRSLSATDNTDAAGWGKGAQVRQDGLWVRCEWSDTGRAAVEGKRYKFNSPCFPRASMVHLGGERYRPTQLGRIALTNNPNLRGQKPLTNSRQPAHQNQANQQDNMDYKQLLLTLLGLPADASDEQITAAMAALEGETVTSLETEVETLETRVEELETELTDADLDNRGITDAGQRTMFRPLLANKATRAAALKTLDALKPPAKTAPARIHNRRSSRLPNTMADLGKGGAGKDDEDIENTDAEAEELHRKAMAYKHEHGVSYETALAAVRGS